MSDPCLALPAVTACYPEGRGLALVLDLAPAAGWFTGHFPGSPVLAGVVQLDWALLLAERWLGLGPLAAEAVQVKFKALIHPGDALILVLCWEPERHRLIFDYHRDGTLCASGRIQVASP